MRSLEFSALAKYAFGLAQLFNAFYHRYPILNEEDADRKRWRAAGVAYFRAQLTRALDLMGIEVPTTGCKTMANDWYYRRAASSKTTSRPSSMSAARSAILDPSMGLTRRSTGVDGLLLTGGDDVAPARYGERRTRRSSKSTPGATSSKSRWSRRRAQRELPIFAICRGIQVLNVACGGTLVQDIPSQVPGALDHSCRCRRNQPIRLAHEVWLEKDTLLSKLMRERLSDADSCEVNSRHHQAVKDVAPGFSVSATAPDGVIEAIEDPPRLLPRRPVAPREFLAHRRVPPAVRGVRRSAQAKKSLIDPQSSNTITVSTCGVFGNRSNASARSIA